MRQIIHIFKKDVRRFWFPTLLTLVLLALFANEDRWRSDHIASLTEGWISLLLPLAWAFLAGAVTLDDALVGDRPFWLALPCRWRSLLAAKALYIAAFIHLPYFLAQSYILAARGFPPYLYLPALFMKQVVLLASITLPAVAIAALVRNVAHFALAGLAVVVGLVVIQAYILPQTIGYRGSFEFVPVIGNRILAQLVAAAGALGLAFLQYARRQTTQSRWMAIAVALLAAVAYAGTPRQASAAIDRALSPPKISAQPAVRVLTGRPSSRGYGAWVDGAVNIQAPIEFTGLPDNVSGQTSLLALEIADSNGGFNAKAEVNRNYAQPSRPRLQAHMDSYPRTPSLWLGLSFDHALYQRLENTRAVVRGSMRIEYVGQGEHVTIPALGRSDLPGWGTCTGMTQPSGFRMNLKLDCESPDDIPPGARTISADSEIMTPKGPVPAIFGMSVSYGGSPNALSPWAVGLSPLNHVDSYADVSEPEEADTSVNRWRWTIPRSKLQTARISFSTDRMAGSELIHFEFPFDEIKKFVLQPQQGRPTATFTLAPAPKK